MLNQIVDNAFGAHQATDAESTAAGKSCRFFFMFNEDGTHHQTAGTEENDEDADSEFCGSSLRKYLAQIKDESCDEADEADAEQTHSFFFTIQFDKLF